MHYQIMVNIIVAALYYRLIMGQCTKDFSACIKAVAHGYARKVMT